MLDPAPTSLKSFDAQMSARGWCLFEGVVDEALVRDLIVDLDEAYEARRAIQIKNGIAAETGGTAHHLLADGKSFLELLRRAYLDEYIKSFFGGNYILNTFGGNLNLRSQLNYANNVHRDVRTYTEEIKLLLNIIVTLDEFTVDNGATHLLTGSHRKRTKPSDEEFFAQADRCVAKSGSIVLWHSNLWHAAGVNKTDRPRRSLSLMYSVPFMKPQFDYARSLGYEDAISFPDVLRQIIGYNARIPASLEDWYQPPETRFYKKDQG